MKKYVKLKRILSLFLAIIILCSSGNISFASSVGNDWEAYAFRFIESKEYFKLGTLIPENILNSYTTKSIFIPLKVKEATITEVNSSSSLELPLGGELIIDGEKHNYELPVKYLYKFNYDNDTREDFIPVWLMENADRSQRVDPEEVQDLKVIFTKALDKVQGLADEIARQGEPKKTGDYHPALRGYALNAITEWEQILLTNPNFTEFNQYLSRKKIETSVPLLYDVIEYIESHRINEPEILDFKIDGYSGIIDKENFEVNIYIPEDIYIDDSLIKIITPDWVIARHISGDLTEGPAIYSVKPIDAIHEKHLDYYGIKDYSHMKKEWTINLLEDEPEPFINSISYTSQYGERIVGDIFGNTINLKIPFEVNLKELSLEVYHTGTSAYYIDNVGDEIEIIDNSIVNGQEIAGVKVIKDDIETTYILNISYEKSKDNEILYFSLEDYDINIDHVNGKIFIKVPYGTDISALKPYIRIDHRAKILPNSGDEQDFTKPITYTIISESGATKEYETVVSYEIASSENKILSFRVGTIDAEIEENNITIEVPSTVNLSNIKPFIQISPNAEVKPSSSEEVNFSKGKVEYIVTAQNGEQRIYKVSIIHSQDEAVGPNEEYMSKLKELRDNIYNKYKKEATFEDWEWMNIGFYEGENNGTPDGIRRTIEDLPRRFNLYNEIGELSSVKITDLARFTMTLTSMGIDATNLEPFQIDGQPFKTDLGKPSGKEVINLVEMMYNGGLGGINGAIFSLIALDMGNYSIPNNSVLSREDYIEFLLNHEYGKDPYGIDMVAMLMQGIYPYQNHPTYGDRVMKKLEHGVEIFTGSKSVKGVEPLNNDFLGISWGDANSESTSQVIIALCSMGIDPFSDYRFSRGPEDNMIVNWIDKFVSPTRDGFGHTNNTNNFMGTYQGMYALQWYINFVENGGKPYSLYYDEVPFDFSTNFSSEAEITKFELLGKEGNIDHENGTITVELPVETSDKRIKTSPIINISENASISPNIGEIQDFTKEVYYTVTAEDGNTTNIYRIIIYKKEDVVSGEKEIRTVSIDGIPNAKVNINNHNRIVSIILPSDTEESKLRNLVLSIDFKGKSIIPNPNESQDFTKDVMYTITAEDGSIAEYTVKVSIEDADKYEFTKFVLRGVEGDIDTIENEIVIKLPFGTYVENIKPNEVEFSPEDSTTSIFPAPTIPQNFDDEDDKIIYSINPFGGDLIDYSIMLDYDQVGGNSKIKRFSIGEHTGTVGNNSITLSVPNGKTVNQFKTELKNLRPSIEWDGKSMDPNPKNEESNSLEDYLKDYVLTDENGNVNLYTVIFKDGAGGIDSEDPNGLDKGKIEMTSFTVNGIKSTIDNGNSRIFLEIPFETENYIVFPIITMSEGTQIYPSMGEAIDLRRNNIFTLRKGDAYKHYTLIVRRAEPKPATMLWRYMEDDLNIPYYQSVD